MPKISIVGPGRVGGAFAIALAKRGFDIDSIVAKSVEAVRNLADRLPAGVKVLGPDSLSGLVGDVVLITTRDDQIEAAAAQLAAAIDTSGRVFLHTSGSRTSDTLASLKTSGGNTGSLHPLVSISDPYIGSGRFEGAYFCVEGDPKAVGAAKAIARALGGNPFEIPTESKPLYHAAAVMACGHLVALISEAVEALEACGPDKETAMRILLPLISSTVSNLGEQDPAEALTGTFARADLETYRAHLDAFAGKVPEEIVAAYLLLGRKSLDLAAEKADPPSGLESLIGEIDRDLDRLMR